MKAGRSDSQGDTTPNCPPEAGLTMKQQSIDLSPSHGVNDGAARLSESGWKATVRYGVRRLSGL